MPSAEAISTPMDWEEAGRAWGTRSTDWAYLFEPYGHDDRRRCSADSPGRRPRRRTMA